MRERPLPGPPLCFFMFFCTKKKASAQGQGIKNWKDGRIPSRHRVGAFIFLLFLLWQNETKRNEMSPPMHPMRHMCVWVSFILHHHRLLLLLLWLLSPQRRTNKQRKTVHATSFVRYVVCCAHKYLWTVWQRQSIFFDPLCIIVLGPPFYPLSLVTLEKRLRSVSTNTRS